MDAMKVWILCFVLIAAFALIAEGSLEQAPEADTLNTAVNAKLFNRQRRQYGGYGGYPGGGGGFGASNAFASANTGSFGGGPFGGGGSSASANAGSSTFNGYGKKK